MYAHQMVRTDSRDQKLQAFFKPANESNSLKLTNEDAAEKSGDTSASTSQIAGCKDNENTPMEVGEESVQLRPRFDIILSKTLSKQFNVQI